jgi:hypothetical protein
MRALDLRGAHSGASQRIEACSSDPGGILEPQMRGFPLRGLLLVLLLCGFVAGCGSSSSPRLSASSAGLLRQRFAAVRVDARAGHRTAALHDLSAASTLVNQADQAGQLTAVQLSALRTGIAQARKRVLIEVAAASPTAPAVTTTTPALTTPTTIAPTPAPAPVPGKDKGKGKGKGKGKDHGHGPDGGGGGA